MSTVDFYGGPLSRGEFFRRWGGEAKPYDVLLLGRESFGKISSELLPFIDDALIGAIPNRCIPKDPWV